MGVYHSRWSVELHPGPWGDATLAATSGYFPSLFCVRKILGPILCTFIPPIVPFITSLHCFFIQTIHLCNSQIQRSRIARVFFTLLRSSLIRSICQIYFKTFQCTLFLIFFPSLNLCLTSSFLILSILVTPYIHCRHIIPITPKLNLCPFVTPQVSVPYVTVDTITLSYNSLCEPDLRKLALCVLFIAPKIFRPWPTLIFGARKIRPATLRPVDTSFMSYRR